jgi:hypothetical protein
MRCQAERRRTLSYFETLRWFRLSQNDKRDDFPQFLFSNQVGGAPAVSSRPVRDSLTRPRLRPLTSASREAGQGVITRRVPWCQGEQGGCPGSSGRERWDRGWQTCKRKIYGIGRGGVGERAGGRGLRSLAPLPDQILLPDHQLGTHAAHHEGVGEAQGQLRQGLEARAVPGQDDPGVQFF